MLRMIHSDHSLRNVFICSLCVNVIFSIWYILLTISRYSSIFGGSGCNHCLVRAFLPADIKTPSRYLFKYVFSLRWQPVFPSIKTLNWKGILTFKTFSNVLCISVQNCSIVGQSQNICQLLVSSCPQTLQHLEFPFAKCIFCFGVMKNLVRHFHPNSLHVCELVHFHWNSQRRAQEFWRAVALAWKKGLPTNDNNVMHYFHHLFLLLKQNVIN